MKSTLYVVAAAALLTAGCAAIPPHRQAAADKLHHLQRMQVAAGLQAEYASIEDAFERAELLQSKDPVAADKFYELALLKSELYEERLAHELRQQARARLAAVPRTKPQPFLRTPRAMVLGQALPELLFRLKEPVAPTMLALKPWSWRPFIVYPEETLPIGADIIGGSSTYVVQEGDTFALIGAKLGTSWGRLARQNGIDPRGLIRPGQKLKYDNRKIVPKGMREGIVINIPDRTLYYFQKGKVAKTVPVALGMSAKDNALWHTPTGTFKITAKIQDPSWFVPPSIQEEMEKAGKEVLVVVPPGDDNPLGKYAFRTSIPGILLHSTNAPGSIYGFSSHGCIRIHPTHMEQLFKEIKVNTQGEIVYEPIKVAVTEKGRIFLEVHDDVYGKIKDLEGEARALLAKKGVEGQVAWQKVRRLLKKKSGMPEDVTLPPPVPAPVQVAEN